MRVYDIEEIAIFSSFRSSLETLDFIAVQRLTPFDFISFPCRPFVEMCHFVGVLRTHNASDFNQM